MDAFGGKVGAERLAQQIREYWGGLGHEVRVWLEPTGRGGWSVPSNLARGLAP
jgi:hypothetical protein